MTRGNGWGAVFHGAQDDRGRLEGFVFQIDPGYSGGRLVLRQRANGGETATLDGDRSARPASTSGRVTTWCSTSTAPR